jgi:hypothetical protein
MSSRHDPGHRDNFGIMSDNDEWTDLAMNAKLNVIGAALATLVISGCATMSADECVSADWKSVGHEDGARGYTTEQFSKHRKACASHGVTPNFADYQAGREGGLVEYCQPGRGFDVGARGGPYHGVCSVNLEPDFLDAYNAGHHLYTLRSRVDNASSSISSREYELKSVDKDIRKKEAVLIDGETTTEQRVILLADLKDLAERTGELTVEIEHLYEDRARYRVELENYQASVVGFGY